MIEIDRDVPITQTRESYPYDDMCAGDSFLIRPNKRSSAMSAAWHKGLKVVTRKEGDMVRVWLVGER